MMPELGKYAGAVLASYGAAITLILVLVALSLWRAARVKRALQDVEGRQEKNDG